MQKDTKIMGQDTKGTNATEASSTTNPSFDTSLLDILACPLTKTPLSYDASAQELISSKAKLAFPIRNGIPILLKEEAREID